MSCALSRSPADRAAGLHDRELVAAEALRCAPRARKILGADPLVHARAMVLARQQVLERFERLGSRCAPDNSSDRQASRTSRAGAVAIAFGEQRPARARTALGADRLVAVKLRTVAASLRSCHIRASARRRISAMLGQSGLAAMNAA